MESSVYSQDGNVNLYFVRQSASCEDACTTAVLCAYQACDENGLNPEWVSSEECLKMAPSKQDVFVIDPFEGDAFKHLTSGFKCVVLGPRCILSCLHRKESIPELPSPIHNTAMKGLVLTSTGFEKEERAKLQLLVERMAGIYSNNFHQGVTHMIANVVGSKKYLVAVEQEVPILTEEWVQAVWRAVSGQGKDQGWGEDVKATDERFLSFSCPVFKGLAICVSQMDRRTKAALKNIIEENGGSYSTSLDMTSTSVLIIPSPEGEKYNHAVNWRIQCLTPDWIYDSVEQGFALKMDGYVVTKRNTSTPTHDTTANVPQPDFSMCSTIMNDTGVPKATHIDETALDVSVLKKKDTDSAEVTRGLESLESLDLQEVMRAGLFLDGCKIFLSGFSAVHLEKLRRVLNAGGATRFNQLSEAVSHVVLGKKVEEHLSTIKSWSSQPHVVYADWITESVRQMRPADELPFTHRIDSDNFRSPSHTNVKVPKRNNANNSIGNDETHVDEEVLSHYLKHQKLDGSNNTNMNESVNTSAFPSSQAGNTAQVFKGKVFTVSGYSEENLKCLVHVIEENGGMVLPKDHQGHVDFALSGSVEEACLSAQEMVSYYYIEDCTEQNKLLPVKYYHMPLQLPGDAYPLGDCTIAISVYAGKERVFLETLTTLLGGMYQEVFAKKSNPSKDIQGSTHLICPEASEGGKYRAAVKWGVPVVTGDWLLACAHTGLRLPEEQFAVTASTSHSLDRKAILRELYEKTVRRNNALNETLPWEETEEVEVAPTPINKKVKALRNQSFCSPSEIKTPDPESFRKLYPTPGTAAKAGEESLSEMKTPETPYGSTWYPSPSPRTRKRFKRMIDAIPDPPQDPKPLLPSTPLEAYNKKFVSEGREFLKNYKIRKTPVYLRKDKKTEQEVELREEEEAVAADRHGPLTGVVICTSRKLQEQQKELYKAVTALGGDYRWVYDPSVTHFIFQGRENDLSKDFRQARDDGKLIVAPDWIWMCQDENSRIDEHLFPHTHNPKMSLSLVGGKSSPVKRKNRLVRKNNSDVAQEVEETQGEEQSNGSIHKEKEEKNSSKDEDEEERAKISKQLEEIDALASNNITSGRREWRSWEKLVIDRPDETYSNQNHTS